MATKLQHWFPEGNMKDGKIERDSIIITVEYTPSENKAPQDAIIDNVTVSLRKIIHNGTFNFDMTEIWKHSPFLEMVDNINWYEIWRRESFITKFGTD